MSVNKCAQTILYDLLKNKVEWHDASEKVPGDTLAKLVEPDTLSYHVAYYLRGEIWDTGDCGIKIGVKRWAEIPQDYWIKYINGEFGTNEAWKAYISRKE